MPERHKDCGSKMFKILISKIAQFTAIYFLRQPTNQPTWLPKSALEGHPLILPRADRAHQARAEPGSWPLSKANSLGSVSQREESKFSQQAIKGEACWRKISKMKCTENVEEKRNKQGGEGRSRCFFKKHKSVMGLEWKQLRKICKEIRSLVPKTVPDRQGHPQAWGPTLTPTGPPSTSTWRQGEGRPS